MQEKRNHNENTLVNEDGFGSIYRITNSQNGMQYIGQTRKEYISSRYDEHFLRARNGVKSPMYDDMRTMDKNSFELDIVENKIPYDELNHKEEMYIEQYDTVYPNGYNVAKGGAGTKGVIPWDKGIPRSEETKRKISEKYTEERRIETSRRMSGENNPNYGKHYKALSRYGETNPFYGRHHTDETKRKLAESQFKKPIMMYSFDGNPLMEFQSSHDAARYIRNNTKYLNADHSFIGRCASGKYQSAYGYIWKYVED